MGDFEVMFSSCEELDNITKPRKLLAIFDYLLKCTMLYVFLCSLLMFATNASLLNFVIYWLFHKKVFVSIYRYKRLDQVASSIILCEC